MERAQKQSLNRRSILFSVITLTVASAIVLGAAQQAEAQQRPAPGPSARKPNILMIMADDIGWFNVSAYNHGMMGYRTPNIDRIAKEGALFTDWYAEQSCTAGRAAFITGQSPIRTGLTKVGLPGADIGLRPEDPSVAEILEVSRLRQRPVRQKPPRRHATNFCRQTTASMSFRQPLPSQRRGRAGKPGLPEEPSVPPTVRTARGQVQSPQPGRTTDRKYGSARPQSAWRLWTKSFSMPRLTSSTASTRRTRPWFCYFNPTRMHVWTHLKAASQGKTGHGVYPDGMVELDGYVGQLLKKLDDLGVSDNTIVVFTTDNGAEVMTLPDGGNTPFRGEKATNWEGGYRAPMVMRWPGTIQPGTVYNEMFSHYDLIPTFAAAGGDPDIVAKFLRGAQIGNKTFKVHLDGYNLMPFFKGDVKESPRKEFIYWNDDGQLVAVRVQRMESRLPRAKQRGHRCMAGSIH